MIILKIVSIVVHRKEKRQIDFQKISSIKNHFKINYPKGRINGYTQENSNYIKK